MRKPHKTAVVAVLLGAIGFLGTGTAYADGQGHGHGQQHKHGEKHAQGHKHGHKHGKKHGKKQGPKQEGKESKSLLISQSTSCTTIEKNVDVQGQFGYQNGREGNLYHGEGSPGSQATRLGSSQGCNNTVVLGR